MDMPVAPPMSAAGYMHRAPVTSHGYKLLYEQLALQTQQTHVLQAEIKRLKTNLAAECSMRFDLQVNALFQYHLEWIYWYSAQSEILLFFHYARYFEWGRV